MENLHVSSLRTFNFEHVGWKYYNNIKKKAMEQEFSWSGLILSLSIAFFVVIFSAACLNLVHQALAGAALRAEMEKKFYRLENVGPQSSENYIQVEYISKEKIRNLAGSSLA